MKYFTALLILLLSFSSCSSSKKIVDKASIKKMSARKIAKKHFSANFNQNTIDARLKATYKNYKEKIGLSVRMKIIKDSVIWFKGSKLITVFKAKITPNKVQFYSSIYKNYFDGDFTMLKNLLGTDINFNQLQNMLLGDAVFNLKAKKHKIEIIDKSYQLTPKKQSELFNIFFNVNPLHYKLNKQFITSPINNNRLDVLYPKYLNKNGILYPEKINIYAKQNNKLTTINIATKSVEFNKKTTINFKIPKGYKEIKL